MCSSWNTGSCRDRLSSGDRLRMIPIIMEIVDSHVHGLSLSLLTRLFEYRAGMSVSAFVAPRTGSLLDMLRCHPKRFRVSPVLGSREAFVTYLPSDPVAFMCGEDYVTAELAREAAASKAISCSTCGCARGLQNAESHFCPIDGTRIDH